MLHRIFDDRLQRHLEHFHFKEIVWNLQLQLDRFIEPDIHHFDIIFDMAYFIAQLHVFPGPFKVIPHHSPQGSQGIGNLPLVFDFGQHLYIL
ncbi:hypothetical protein D3C76_1587720 [compost metagenome]